MVARRHSSSRMRAMQLNDRCMQNATYIMYVQSAMLFLSLEAVRKGGELGGSNCDVGLNVRSWRSSLY